MPFGDGILSLLPYTLCVTGVMLLWKLLVGSDEEAEEGQQQVHTCSLQSALHAPQKQIWAVFLAFCTYFTSRRCVFW